MFLTLVFTYLLNIRFRKDKPINEVLSTRYGRPLVTTYRHLQRTRYRRDKAALDLEFLKTCKVGGVIPKFLYFKAYSNNFSDSKLYRSILFKCLNFEIKSKQKIHAKLKAQYLSEVNSFNNQVSWLDSKFFFVQN